MNLVDLFHLLSDLCETSEKPIVLMIDEIDSASNNQVFLDFLGLLRDYYLDRKQTATFWSVILAGVAEAVRVLLNESNTLFDDMRKRVTDYPELKKMLYAILFYGQSFAYNPDNYVMDIGVMFGFLKESAGQVVIANRIFETRLYNLFMSEELLANKLKGIC